MSFNNDKLSDIILLENIISHRIDYFGTNKVGKHVKLDEIP